jgi:hypothetical protein
MEIEEERDRVGNHLGDVRVRPRTRHTVNIESTKEA